MQKVSLFLILILTAILSCGDEESFIPTNGLVAYYSFDGDSDDAVGSADGTDMNIIYTYVNKKHKQAATFSSVNSYITLGSDFDFEQRTISMDIYVQISSDATYRIFTSDHSGTQFGTTQIHLAQWQGIPILYFTVANQTAGTTSAFKETTWHHVTLVADQKSYRYYLDGELITSAHFDEYTHAESGPEFAVIGRPEAGKNSFRGMIDNLRIYDRALTEKEIVTLAKN